MSISSWFHWRLVRHQKRRPRLAQSPAARRHDSHLCVERLEDRTVPSTYTAATVPDLIADIRDANLHGGSNTISLVAGNTFTLTARDTNYAPNGLPLIATGNNLTIEGNGDTIERSTASGTPDFRVFGVALGASLTVEDATLQGGLSYLGGGAIYNAGTLDLKGVTVQNNLAQGGTGAATGAGGGIYSSGSLTLEAGTIIRGNQAVGRSGRSDVYEYMPPGNALGGGVYVSGGTATLTDTTISANTAQGGAMYGYSVPPPGPFAANGYGGGVYVAAGAVTLTNVTLSSNLAVGGDVHSSTKYGIPGSGFGGGLYAAGGTVTLRADSVTGNSAQSGTLNNGHKKAGVGGGLYIAPTATVYLDAFTLANTKHNNPDDMYGSFILI